MPIVADTRLYVKLILRTNCVLVSFHEAENRGEEEDGD